ncbi:MAG: hypothetical protein ABSD59_02440 [Terracidiphilus sp.]|jgi:hypothetical protein
MKRKAASVLCAIVGLLAMIGSSLSAFAQNPNIHVLLIHGRHSPCPNFPYTASSCSNPETYGVLTTDQAGAWGNLGGLGTLNTAGNVLYVQWDAWDYNFDYPTWPGGEAVMQSAMSTYCSNGQTCVVICHSAGCPAIEYFISTLPANSPTVIYSIIAPGSAAGGSELASDDFGGILADIDVSLEPSNARSMYNHNNMQGVPVRAIAGTDNSDAATQFSFPSQTAKPWNPDCTQPLGLYSTCDDDTVALHSSCGHNQAASYQNCLSKLAPNTDTSTYSYHGWWVDDSYGKTGTPGPYSATGKSVYQSTFHTYSENHDGTANLSIAEYNACHLAGVLAYCP